MSEPSDAAAAAGTPQSVRPPVLSGVPSGAASDSSVEAPLVGMAAPRVDAYPDSGPTLTTVTDAPEAPGVNIRIPRFALLVPIAACATYLFVALRPTPPVTSENEPRTAQAEASPEASAEQPGPALEGATLEAKMAEAAQADPAALEASAAITTVRIAELERARAQTLRAAEQLDAARRRVKVVLYSTERCTRCTEARNHLVAQGIRPTERDIDKDPKARARHRALARKGGLPTIEVDGKVLVGFQEERLDKAIDRAATLRLQRKR